MPVADYQLFDRKGNQHGFLPNRFDSTAAGTTLKSFIGGQITDVPDWTDAIDPAW